MDNPFKDGFKLAFNKFYSIYEPDLIVRHPERKPRLAPAKERFCRFCFRMFPEVTFRKTAHVFPQLIENKNIIHDCECDDCNRLFGTYEDSFSKFLGLTRTTEFIKGQAGIPSFRSGDGRFSMYYGKDKEGNHLLRISGDADEIKTTLDEIEFRTVKQTYIPLHVMKCLYKIGYSLVSPLDLQHYNPTRKILISSELDHLLTNFAGVVRFTFPHPAHSPMAVRYRKKDVCRNLKHPSTVISLHFSRYTYQFFLIDLRDTFIFDHDKPFDFLFTPPPFPGNQSDIYLARIDLSGTQKKMYETDAAIFRFDENT